VQRMTDQLRIVSAEGYAACCDALSEADLRDEIDRIFAPTLVIAGRYDSVTTVADAQFIVERMPNARLATLDASHLSNIEAAQAFNAAVLAFLAA
jgi:3-oxoadipate enol-lactonase